MTDQKTNNVNVDNVTVRQSRPEDIDGVIDLCQRVYPGAPPWSRQALESHQRIFPEGQLVAVDGSGKVVGMAASLIILWADYDSHDSWRDFTDSGMFTNHDPEHGKTLYGAEVMVDPACQGCGIGKQIYAARREICKRFKLKRIRAGARLRNYHLYADRMDPVTYVEKIIAGELTDPTLTFQIRQGFEVLAVVQGYLRHDPDSLGWAALIEWRNPDQISPEDVAGKKPLSLARAAAATALTAELKAALPTGATATSTATATDAANTKSA